MNAVVRRLPMVKPMRVCTDRRDVPRPCPYTDCRHSLVAERAKTGVAEDGTLDSCSLDVADRGEHSLIEIATMLGLSKERVRQIESQIGRKYPREFKRLREAASTKNIYLAEPKTRQQLKRGVTLCRCGRKPRHMHATTCKRCHAERVAKHEPKCKCLSEACENRVHRPKEYCAECRDRYRGEVNALRKAHLCVSDIARAIRLPRTLVDALLRERKR